jgi:predicted transglutaminase-like cysteine proteinase
LVRFRRLLELARDLKPRQQVNLVQAYFNAVAWTSEDRDTWLPLVQVAAGRRGDCEDVALAKYATLRRLGWAADSLRVVVGWDAEEHDWHAWLLVDDAGAVQVLDSIKEPQTLRHFHASRAVYSISELGVWDHAPDFVPVAADHDPERAARFAALDRKGDSK